MGCIMKPGRDLHGRLRIGAVLLAAGEGRRMGGVAKPLIRVQGVPLIKRHLIALGDAGVDQVVVVTGFERDAVQAQVQAFPVTLAHNAAYADGQQGSVRTGLEALGGRFDAVLVMLADQPLIGAGDLTELISAYRERAKREDGQVLMPMVNGQRGNPILLDARVHARILASDTDLTCREFIDSHPELVLVHETANPSFVTDIDTPEDMRQLAGRTGWKFELPAREAAA